MREGDICYQFCFRQVLCTPLLDHFSSITVYTWIAFFEKTLIKMANEDKFVRDEIRNHVPIHNVTLVALKAYDVPQIAVSAYKSSSTTFDLRLTVDSFSAIMHCLRILSTKFAIFLVDFKKKTNSCSNVTVDAAERIICTTSLQEGVYKSQFKVSDVRDNCIALSHEAINNFESLEDLWKECVDRNPKSRCSTMAQSTHARFVVLGEVKKERRRRIGEVSDTGVIGAVADTGGILVPDAKNCNLKAISIKLKTNALDLDDEDRDLGEVFSARFVFLYCFEKLLIL